MLSVLVMRFDDAVDDRVALALGLAADLERVGVHRATSGSSSPGIVALGQHGVEGGLGLAAGGVGGGQQRPPVEVVGVLLAEHLDLLGREVVDLRRGWAAPSVSMPCALSSIELVRSP